MIFSTVLLSIEAIKKEQQKGSIHPQKYDISLVDLMSDYNSMMAFYEAFNSATPELKQAFFKEVKAFYLLVDSIYLRKNNLSQKENEQLGAIYLGTKRVREAIGFALSHSGNQLT